MTRIVAEKTGLPHQKAADAVEAALEALKSKLPPLVGAQIEAVLDGSAGNGSFENLTGGLRSLFGRK